MKETKELLSFAIEFVEAVLKSLEDGKINVSDIMNFRNVIPKIGPAISGADRIKDELMLLDSKQMSELSEFFKREFDIKDDRAEAIVESVIDLVIAFLSTAKKVKAKK